MNFTPFPNLATERLTLRELKIEDENEIFVLRSDERILKYLDIPRAETVDDARKFIARIIDLVKKNESIMWGINLKDSDKLIGTICLWNISEDNTMADIGYMLHPDFQGQGIMQEAIVQVIGYGFGIMNLKIISAEVEPGNAKSINLLERNGFTCTSKAEHTVIYSLAKVV